MNLESKMETLTIIYLVYLFVGLYYLFLFMLIYFQNKSELFYSPKPKKEFSLSIIIPCFNAEKNIAKTIQALLDSDYGGLKKIIVVDDCSVDNSYEVAKKFQKKYPKKVLVVRTPKNTGNAAGAKNYGAKFAKTELIGFTDDDSHPQKEAIGKMIGFFNNKKVSAVTSRVLVENRDTFMANLQAMEYKVIAFTRKLLGFVDGIYVTNGPLSIYTIKAFKDVGGFDEKNLTEDIEITWHMVAKGYLVRMSLGSQVYTIVPDNFKSWLKQRIRWNVGGVQSMDKYKKAFFSKGMLGKFILPFFIIAWTMAIFGFLVLVYRFSRTVLVRYLSTKMSIEAQTAILSMNDLNLTPSILAFFGFAMLSMTFFYNLLAFAYSKEKQYKNHSPFGLFLYMVVYLSAYPLVLISSIIAFFRGKTTW